MHKETMTPKERWLAVLNHQIPDRVPMDYWATGETTAKLIKHMGTASLHEALKKLHVDFVVTASPQYVGPTHSKDTDEFGIHYVDINYGTGVYREPNSHPLAKYKSVDEIKKDYQFPSVDWYDFSGIKDQVSNYETYPVCGGGSEPFLTYKELRGYEQAFIDLTDNPEIVHYVLDQLFNLAYERTKRIIESLPQGTVTYCYVAEDMGGQTNLMISPRHIREYLLPGMKRMIELTHSAGAFAFHHNDGNVTRILPDMVALGIDILNPIQWRANGMAREFLKSTYGDKLVFHGAVDNQHTLPFGTAQEVKDEVIENLKILGKNGGYILAPCHNIQPVTPVENIISMYETGYTEGFY